MFQNCIRSPSPALPLNNGQCLSLEKNGSHIQKKKSADFIAVFQLAEMMMISQLQLTVQFEWDAMLSSCFLLLKEDSKVNIDYAIFGQLEHNGKGMKGVM